MSIVALLVCSPVLVFFSPKPLDDLQDLLIFCGGFANLAALTDTCSFFGRSDDKTVRTVFAAQLFIFAIILGFDAAKLLNRDLRLAVCVLAVLALFGMVIAQKDSTNGSYIMLGLGIVLATYLAPEIGARIAMEIERLPMDINGMAVAFIGPRVHAWTHLLAIPALYLIVDSIVQSKVPAAKRALRLDRQVFTVGCACAAAGVAMAIAMSVSKNPVPVAAEGLFEAGSSAAILILGNWIYSSYVSEQELARVSKAVAG